MTTKILSCLAGAGLFALTASAVAKNYDARFDTSGQVRELTERLWNPAPGDVTRLWPSNAVPFRADEKPLRILLRELRERNVVVTDVNDPFFVFYRASAPGPRPVVVILPGGGYSVLGVNKEGTEIAEWLNGIGFSAAVLVYRAPDQRRAALCDVQRTIGLLRAGAAKYGIDPDRVGVIGFSAGANLAATVSTNWRKRAYGRVDAADDRSCRPDFQMPIYPWDLRTRKNPDTHKAGWEGMSLRPEYPVDGETPPAFIAQTLDDFCEIETTVAYDLALRTNGVDSVARIYPSGGHGYGARRRGQASDAWRDEASSWLARWLKPSKKVLFLGDSITDRRHVGCTKNYWGYLADRYGFHPSVYGVNGQRMCHVAAQADRYAAENPGAEPDVVFVFAGTNDYNGNVPLGEWYVLSEEKANRNGREVTVKRRTFSRDGSTLRGRINLAMEHLRAKFPLARVVLLTPLHRGYARFGETNVQPDESYANELGLFIDDYAAAIREAGNVWAVKVVDLHSASGLYPNAEGQAPLFHDAKSDRLHPSADGHRRIAEAIALEVGDWLKSR